ncbi:MAG: DUF3780 domain-containing protein [Burkholderiales bacterium]
MRAQAKPNGQEKIMGFGFVPEESTHHFLVTIPASNRQHVLISEHYTWEAGDPAERITFSAGVDDGKLRATLERQKWNAIADEARAEFNRRLKKQGLPAGAWKMGGNPLARLLGKELTLLAWAIEDADPTLIPTALKNWLGLMPEERWWLFTMTNAATGHAVHGRGKGWRKAVRFALTENPVSETVREPMPELFQLVAKSETAETPVTKPRRARK